MQEPCWSLPALTRLKQSYEQAGFSLDVIEDNPPMDKIRLGLPGGDQQIEWFCDQLRAMGELGIPVLCYNWVSVVRLGTHRRGHSHAWQCARDRL